MKPELAPNIGFCVTTQLCQYSVYIGQYWVRYPHPNTSQFIVKPNMGLPTLAKRCEFRKGATGKYCHRQRGKAKTIAYTTAAGAPWYGNFSSRYFCWVFYGPSEKVVRLRMERVCFLPITKKTQKVGEFFMGWSSFSFFLRSLKKSKRRIRREGKVWWWY